MEEVIDSEEEKERYYSPVKEEAHVDSKRS